MRSFEKDNIAHVEGNLNPIRDIEIIETELLIRDLNFLEKRIGKLHKIAMIRNKESKEELKILEIIYQKMNNGELLHDIFLDDIQTKYIHPLSLFTNKPTLYVANVDDYEITKEERSSGLQQLFDFFKKRDNFAIRLCGKLESEISNLLDVEKKLFLEEYNLKNPGLNKLVHASYKLLGLETFFTVGEKEVRAWTIINGVSALMAAGQIHTDMERGFIKAEVYSFKDLLEYKSELALKDAGKIRQEGKNYIVQDGDVIFFKFNV